MTTTGHVKFIGGRLCLDFVNTLSGRMDPAPVERLQRYGDLVAWARNAGLMGRSRTSALLRAARQDPAHAARVLGRARAMRECVHRLCRAAADGRKARREDLEVLNDALADAVSHLKIGAAAGGVEWTWVGTEHALEQPLWPIARSTAELLTTSAAARVKECPGRHCGWLFLDRTKNRSRRWCEMSVCGNRAKARRHYRRKTHGCAAGKPRG
ncbi:MAG: CGNR zinc finger domain-containing protein [Alphaproteobacteria bacterium]